MLLLFPSLLAVFFASVVVQSNMSRSRFRTIVFHHQMMKKMHKQSKKYYDKLNLYLIKFVTNYNELSEDDKTIIETVISLMV